MIVIVVLLMVVMEMEYSSYYFKFTMCGNNSSITIQLYIIMVLCIFIAPGIDQPDIGLNEVFTPELRYSYTPCECVN